MSTTSSTSSTSSSTKTNFLTTLGAGSGVDTKSLAENLVEAARAPRRHRERPPSWPASAERTHRPRE